MTEDQGFRASDYHIVVIDDEESMLVVLRLALSMKGYRLSFFNNAPDALEWMKSHPFHLLLTDYHMAIMNGYELVQKVRAEGLKNQVLLMSGQLSDLPREEFNALGVWVFLEKPFSPMLLDEVLRTALSWKSR